MPVRLENQRNVRELREGGVERLEELYVLVGVSEVVLPAYDVCDFHADVVDDVHEVENRSAV